MTQDRVNVLIVDDKPENLLALENILRSADLRIVRATSGNEALAKLLEMDFGCVLLDVKMPDMDGFELARIVRSDERTKLIPIIFSSGHQRAESDVFKGYETGAVDYLLKPLDPTIVRSKVKVFAELYRKNEALKQAEAAMADYARELKNANEELEKRVADRMKELSVVQAQAAQLQKMDAIGSLAGGVAHDFNNLLSAINMYCDFATNHLQDREKMLETMDEIREVASRGAALTRQLLIFSRKQIVQPNHLQLKTSVEGLLKMLRRLIGENIEISTRFDENVGLIHADAGQIEQVVLNLVVNARDAMEKGGTVTIEIANTLLTKESTGLHLSGREGPHVVLTVSDTGVGMNEETRNRIFEPFFTTKPIGKGTGLGLSTVYGIVKQAGGTIGVDSRPGQGSVFKIYFPVVEGRPADPEKRPQSDARIEGGGETIVLVEDDDILRKLYSNALSGRGYQVFSFANGKEAVEMISGRGHKIDLLLSDVVMPLMGGFELARRALEHRPQLPILFMSGYTDENMEDQHPEVQKRAQLINKPFNTEALVAKIQAVLQKQLSA